MSVHIPTIAQRTGDHSCVFPSDPSSLQTNVNNEGQRPSSCVDPAPTPYDHRSVSPHCRDTLSPYDSNNSLSRFLHLVRVTLRRTTCSSTLAVRTLFSQREEDRSMHHSSYSVEKSISAMNHRIGDREETTRGHADSFPPSLWFPSLSAALQLAAYRFPRTLPSLPMRPTRQTSRENGNMVTVTIASLCVCEGVSSTNS